MRYPGACRSFQVRAVSQAVFALLGDSGVSEKSFYWPRAWNPEALKEIVPKSFSIREVTNRLGLVTGLTQRNAVIKYINYYNLDVSHFKYPVPDLHFTENEKFEIALRSSNVLKRCSRCKEEKKVFEFSIDRRSADGRSLYCRDCNKTIRKESNKMFYKKCCACGKDVQLAKFSRDQKEKDGFSEKCKECTNNRIPKGAYLKIPTAKEVFVNPINAKVIEECIRRLKMIGADYYINADAIDYYSSDTLQAKLQPTIDPLGLLSVRLKLQDMTTGALLSFNTPEGSAVADLEAYVKKHAEQLIGREKDDFEIAVTGERVDILKIKG